MSQQSKMELYKVINPKEGRKNKRTRGIKNRQDKQKTNSKMVDLNTTIINNNLKCKFRHVNKNSDCQDLI